MATKNLARSIIEGGRSGHYKAECARRMSEERSAWRAQARAIVLDPESYDEEVPAKRGHVLVDFSDKLSIIHRFLLSNVGRSWDEVRSELFDKFDIRTTPGRHVLFDHLLRDVADSPEEYDRAWGGPPKFFRDGDGKLRETEYWTKNHWWPPQKKEPQVDLRAVAAWLGSVKVGRAGRGFARFVAVGGARVRAVVERGAIAYAACDERNEPIYVPQPPTVYTSAYSGRTTATPQPPKLLVARCAFRQDGMLDAREGKIMRAWPMNVQEMVCALAPSNT
jgi:hypothetical protein